MTQATTKVPAVRSEVCVLARELVEDLCAWMEFGESRRKDFKRVDLFVHSEPTEFKFCPILDALCMTGEYEIFFNLDIPVVKIANVEASDTVEIYQDIFTLGGMAYHLTKEGPRIKMTIKRGSQYPTKASINHIWLSVPIAMTNAA